jgi:hypothetical protein
MNKADWIWMPHPGHLIVGQECRFTLNTCVGEFLVSTVGEWLPSESMREIIAQTQGVMLNGRGDEREYDYLQKLGFKEIGADRLYETMVFRAKRRTKAPLCCAFEADHDGGDLDFAGYNDPVSAAAGHMELCEKWAARK